MQTLAAITVDVAFIAVVFVAFFFVRPELPKKKRASEDDLTSTVIAAKVCKDVSRLKLGKLNQGSRCDLGQERHSIWFETTK